LTHLVIIYLRKFHAGNEISGISKYIDLILKRHHYNLFPADTKFNKDGGQKLACIVKNVAKNTSKQTRII